MRIGFTYDLRDDYLREGYTEEETAEFDAAETIDAIEAALTSLGHVGRSHRRHQEPHQRVWPPAIGGTWSSTTPKGMFGFAREAQVPALLDAFQIPYTFSDGLVFALTLHKGMTKHVVREPRHSDARLRRRLGRSDVASASACRIRSS